MLSNFKHHLTTRVNVLVASLLAAVIVVMTPAIAAAAVVPPAQPSINRSTAPWIGLAIMFVMLAIIMFISLMPSKRSHQD